MWVVAPYKKPERDLPDNERFNNHLSMLRIRSEHCIGFLKGLRVRIINEATHKLATYWIATCIGLHSFAMQYEDHEQVDDNTLNFEMRRTFINEGLSSSSESEGNGIRACRQQTSNSRRLQVGKKCWEQLKRRLLCSINTDSL
jgi:hypothetical protein